LNQPLHDSAIDSSTSRTDQTIERTAVKFSDLGIVATLLKAVERLKFESPTPIQAEAIPAGIEGEDIIAIAKTGSGKTIAFGIPMLQRLLKTKRGTGLVIVPTRELALQVEESLQAFSRPIHMRSVVLIGGASMMMQRNELKRNPRIIIATPGRLMDHIDRRSINLDSVGVFILDEADRMLDMGFIPDIKKIMQSIPEGRQTMLFSATMPKEIEAIAEKFMVDPTRIEVDRSGVTPNEVSHEMFYIQNQDKGRLLAVKLKKCTGPVLVFTRTKRMASRLTDKVNNMGFAAAEIHSNRSMGQRRAALEGFKRGRYQVLIATDIAARGIDVKGIELVVNYDMPANSEDYVHRIGRTGRAGKTGKAVSFATKAQKRDVRDIERFLKIKLAPSAIPTLPTEKLLFREAVEARIGLEPVKDDLPSLARPSRDRAPRRSGYKPRQPWNFERKQGGSRPTRFNDRNKSRINSRSPRLEENRASRPESAPDAFSRKVSTRFDSRTSRFDDRKPTRTDSRPGSFQNRDSNRSDSRPSRFDDRKPNRSDSRPGNFQKRDSNRPDSRPSRFDDRKPTRSNSRPGSFQKRDSNRSDSRPSRYADKNSKRADSRRNDSKPHRAQAASQAPRASQAVDSGQNEAKGKTPFWAIFKSSKPAKKKSANKGARRKKRTQ
jgi:ATP-dependent RNA helicase RhlE